MIKEFLGKVLMWVLILAVIAGAWIGYNWFNSGKTTIDNPTDQAITFTLDGKDYTLQANSQQTVKLGRGEHTLVYSGETVKFEKGKGESSTNDYIGGKMAVLNPTRSEYVYYRQIYSTSMSDSAAESIVSIYECPEGRSENPRARCPFKFHDDVLIEVDADYGLTADLPNTASIRRGATYTIKTKLFRGDDFVKFWNEE